MALTDRIRGVTASLAVKAPVVAATLSNITLSGEQTIDGVAVVDGNRVLVKNQTDATENGIYDVSTGAWTRSLDFNGVGDITGGTWVLVLSGSMQAGSTWYVSNTAAITLGVTALVFASLPRYEATVEDYGAIGDGVVDDTAAIQAALDAIGTRGGGVVKGRAASYLISYTLTIPAKTRMILGGIEATTLDVDDGNWTGDDVVITDSPTAANLGTPYIGLEDFTIDINGETSIKYGVRMRAAYRSSFANIKVEGFNAPVQYTATSGQTAFAVPWTFPTNNRVRATRQSAAEVIGSGRTIDVKNQIVYNAAASTADQYTLTGAGTGATGTLTLGSGATTGDVVTIWLTGEAFDFSGWNQYEGNSYTPTFNTTTDEADLGGDISDFSNGDRIRVKATTSLPGGLTAGDSLEDGTLATVYYYASFVDEAQQTLRLGIFPKATRAEVTADYTASPSTFTINAPASQDQLAEDMKIRIGTNGSLPTSLTADGTFDDDVSDDACSQEYYAVNYDDATGTFEVSATAGGAGINFSDAGDGATLSVQGYADVTSAGSGTVTITRYLMRAANRCRCVGLEALDAPIGLHTSRGEESQNTYGGSFLAFHRCQFAGYIDKGVFVEFGENNTFYTVSCSTGQDFTYAYYISDSITQFFNCHGDSSKSNSRIAAVAGGTYNLVQGVNRNHNTGWYFTATAGGSGLFGFGGNGCFNRVDFENQTTFEGVVLFRGDSYEWVGNLRIRDIVSNTTTSLISLSGGSSRTTGGTWNLYGGSHATLASVGQFNQDNVARFRISAPGVDDFIFYDEAGSEIARLEATASTTKALLLGASARDASEKLHVVGSAVIKGSLQIGASGADAVVNHIANNRYVAYSGGLTQSAGANHWMYGNTAAQANRHLIRQNGINRIVVENTVGDADITFHNKAGTEIARLDGVANALLVGTSSLVASEKLHVNGQAAFTLSTATLEILDAGTAGATEAGWVTVEVGGTAMYLRAYSAI